MKTKIKVHPKIQSSFSAVFSDANRVIMEYNNNTINASENFKQLESTKKHE